MLNQLRAVDAGDQKLGAIFLRAIVVMQRTMKQLLLQDRTVDFAKLSFCLFVIDSDNDAVGMQKIEHRRPFAQKLRIRRNREAPLGIAAVNAQGPQQLLPGLRRYRALFDDQLRAAGLLRDQARGTVDCAQVGIAIFQRRRSHADENRVAETDRLSQVGSEAQPIGNNIAA
jgi:hypothetical protein